ncbi:MAG: hypothetical protein ACPGWM_02330, partial [Flavobacteriales bacterium]
KEFQNFLLSDTSRCDLNNFGLYETSYCDEICETFLVELNNKRKTAAPCDYDQGILGMNFSPACEKLVVCSSYDGSDYDNYYQHRAEIVVFRMTENDGLDALAPSTRITFNNWSIENYAWINKDELAVKLYSGSSYESEQNQDYSYFRLSIKEE